MEYTKEQLTEIRRIELDLYDRFAAVCKRYNLRFVTGFGTTLGAIRHHGFIPWDDDMDFLMPRRDYEKLVKIAPREFTGIYEFLEPRVTRGYVMAFAKLQRRDSTFIEETDLYRSAHYHMGIYIDIFPMDYWPQNKTRRDRLSFRCYCLLRLCVLAVYKKPKLPDDLDGFRRKLIYAGCSVIHCFLGGSGLTKRKLYNRYLRLALSVTPEEADGYVTDLCWCWPRRDGMVGLQYPEEGLFRPLYVTFEGTVIPVPEEYDNYLTTAYRDYMKLPPEEKRHSHKPAVLKFPEKEHP